jgi:hypothetical protein
MLSDRRDLTRLADAFERAAGFARDPGLRSVVRGVYAGGMLEIGKKFSRPSMSTAITWALALALDAAGGLRENAFPLHAVKFRRSRAARGKPRGHSPAHRPQTKTPATGIADLPMDEGPNACPPPPSAPVR